MGYHHSSAHRLTWHPPCLPPRDAEGIGDPPLERVPCRGIRTRETSRWMTWPPPSGGTSPVEGESHVHSNRAAAKCSALRALAAGAPAGGAPAAAIRSGADRRHLDVDRLGRAANRVHRDTRRRGRRVDEVGDGDLAAL